MSGAGTHAATFRLPVADEAAAGRLVKVLAVEAAATPAQSRVTVRSEAASVRLDVEAGDARTLRAAANSILRLAAVAVDLEDAPAKP